VESPTTSTNPPAVNAAFNFGYPSALCESRTVVVLDRSDRMSSEPDWILDPMQLTLITSPRSMCWMSRCCWPIRRSCF
jgi:hypothetical protein